MSRHHLLWLLGHHRSSLRRQALRPLMTAAATAFAPFAGRVDESVPRAPYPGPHRLLRQLLARTKWCMTQCYHARGCPAVRRTSGEPRTPGRPRRVARPSPGPARGRWHLACERPTSLSLDAQDSRSRDACMHACMSGNSPTHVDTTQLGRRDPDRPAMYHGISGSPPKRRTLRL
jgi:hypothetical protein